MAAHHSKKINFQISNFVWMPQLRSPGVQDHAGLSAMHTLRALFVEQAAFVVGIAAALFGTETLATSM
jgi:hypothetical protein